MTSGDIIGFCNRGTQMLRKLRNAVQKKGQGIIEYALLLAFVVGIAIMLNGSNIGGAVIGVFDDVVTFLGGEKTYAEYYTKWHDYSANQLAKIPNEERIKADREALAIIARTFIGLTPEMALDRLGDFTNGNSWSGQSALLAGNATEGYSQGVLVPLSYYDNFDQDGYIRLDKNLNYNTVQYLAPDSEAYLKNNSPVANTTIVKDRLFYSNDMIGSSNGEQKTISARLNYKNGVVDSVDITARKGTWDKDIATNLNINVTKTSYTVNDQDYVRYPQLRK